MLQHIPLPGGTVNVGVDLGCENVRVSKHLLHLSQIRSSLNQVGGEGMPEGMRGNLLCDSGGESLPFHDVENGNTAQLLARLVQEKDILGFSVCGFCPDCHIAAYRIRCRFAQRDKPFLIAFAENPDIALVEEDIRDPERRGLADSQPAAVQDFQYGPVPDAARSGEVHGFQYVIHLPDGEHGGEIFSGFRSLDTVGRVRGDEVLLHHPPAECPD